MHLVAEGADRVVARLRAELLRLVARQVAARRPALRDPLLARAVHELDVVVPVVPEVPVGVGGEPVVAIAVEHDRVLARDAAAAEQLAELRRPQEVALDLILEIPLPVEADRAGDVRLRVERGVLVDLHDADRVVAEVVLDPLRVDKYVVRVIAHLFSLKGSNLDRVSTLDAHSARAGLLWAFDGARAASTGSYPARRSRPPRVRRRRRGGGAARSGRA